MGIESGPEGSQGTSESARTVDAVYWSVRSIANAAAIAIYTISLKPTVWSRLMKGVMVWVLTLPGTGCVAAAAFCLLV